MTVADCYLCGERLTGLLSKVRSIYSDDFSILECENCRMGFTEPVLDEQKMSKVYQANYEYEAHSFIETEKKLRFRHLVRNIDFKDYSVLDVGCMYGYVLDEVKKQGALRRVGVEINNEAVQVCRSNGHVVHSGLEQIKEQFDRIILLHVIEHILSDKDFLISLNRYIKPSGLLILTFPNFQSRTRRLFKRVWGWYQVPFHYRHYSIPSMSKLLNQSGYQIDTVGTRGADSLMILSTLMSVLKVSPTKNKGGYFTKVLVKMFSFLTCIYLFFGDEEIFIVAKKQAHSKSLRY